MVLGMSLAAFTMVHVVISLIGIVSGFFVLFGLFGSNRMPGMTALFLVTTILTSVTGFLFPFEKLLPSYILGILSLIVLAMLLAATAVAGYSARNLRFDFNPDSVFSSGDREIAYAGEFRRQGRTPVQPSRARNRERRRCNDTRGECRQIGRRGRGGF